MKVNIRVLVAALIVAILSLTVVAPTNVLAVSAEAASSSGCGEFYTVQRGDNLFRIALRYGTTVKALSDLNGITNPNQIRAGQLLCVRKGRMPVPHPGCAQFHVVQRGENLFRIAMRYGTRVQALANLNGISDPSQLRAGQALCIQLEGQQAGDFYYTVQRGDTLFSLARRFGLSVSRLAAANDIANVNRIYTGQVLVIPGR